jgi:hypothetical protein
MTASHLITLLIIIRLKPKICHFVGTIIIRLKRKICHFVCSWATWRHLYPIVFRMTFCLSLHSQIRGPHPSSLTSPTLLNSSHHALLIYAACYRHCTLLSSPMPRVAATTYGPHHWSGQALELAALCGGLALGDNDGCVGCGHTRYTAPLTPACVASCTTVVG